MAVSTQLGLLLWKNFTYRRRQTVSEVTDAAFFLFFEEEGIKRGRSKKTDVILGAGERRQSLPMNLSQSRARC